MSARGLLLLVLFAVVALGTFAPEWTWSMLVQLDRVANGLLLGDPGETVSSRLGRWLLDDASTLRRFVAQAACAILELFDENHCLDSVE